MQGKKVILAVTGSIAAYKSAVLTRLLIKSGCRVKVLMTKAATAFISPLTLSTLSQNPVFTGIISEEEWNNHVDLGLWADAMVVAPATANSLAKCANGLADNIVTATYLSARCPVFFAPAMDLDMWTHSSTVANLTTLKEYGNHIIPVGHGELASGLVGDGRMAEPEEIVKFIESALSIDQPLKGKTALITAGPTHEAIDPVRFIGNRSTGRMGLAIADALESLGAAVQVVLGPTHLTPTSDCKIIRVSSAEEMYTAAETHFDKADITVFTAAVADFTPKHVAETKIKKEDEHGRIDLKRTKDIARELSSRKSQDQLTVGFALETDNELANAREKLRLKNLDLIVLNSLRDEGAGFGGQTNKVTFVYPGDRMQQFELKSKDLVAKDIANAIVQLLKSRES